MSEDPQESLHIQGGEQENLQEQASQEASSEPKQPQHADKEASEEQGSASKKSGGGLTSAMSSPSAYGNKAGSAIENTLGKVGSPIGKGLETVTKPIGGVVGAVVDAPFKAGEMATGKGEAGETVTKEAAQAEKDEEILAPKGGKDQTGQNPLGL